MLNSKEIILSHKCVMCKMGEIILDTLMGELVCNYCGIVSDERIEDSSVEGVQFSKHDGDRTGSPTSLAIHDMGLATVIGNQNKDAYGRILSIPMIYTMVRLRKWDKRSQTPTTSHKRHVKAFSMMNNLKTKLVLSDEMLEKSAYIYRKAIERGLSRGRSIQGLVAASLYAVCRNYEIPRTLDDIAQEMGMKRKEVAKCYRLLLTEFDFHMPVADPMKCVAKIANKVALSEKTKRKALQILKDAIDAKISMGKDPMGLAAAALYLSCILECEKKSQKDIAKAAGVTEMTVRSRYRGLRMYFNI